MVSAPPVPRGFSPLDDEVELLPGSLTPRFQEHLVRLCSLLPSFAKAAAELTYCTQADISRASATRITEAAGAAAVAVQTAEVERIEREYPDSPLSPDTLLLSADGAMVPLLHGEWAEAKTVAIGEVAPPKLERGELVVHTTKLSYFSRLADSESFGHLAVGEVQRAVGGGVGAGRGGRASPGAQQQARASGATAGSLACLSPRAVSSASPSSWAGAGSAACDAHTDASGS